VEAVAAAVGAEVEAPVGDSHSFCDVIELPGHREGMQLPRKRHIPERTCVACGDKKPKATLVRIVRSPLGTVSLDPTGKAQGRGAYVCGPECWATALGRGRLTRSLGHNFSADELETLRVELLQA
jgi:predicted RNA-binding protein YlxR (DUF448 family)